MGQALTKEGGAVDFDVMTELGFPDRAAFLNFARITQFPDQHGQQVATDEAKFLVRSGPGPMSSRNT